MEFNHRKSIETSGFLETTLQRPSLGMDRSRRRVAPLPRDTVSRPRTRRVHTPSLIHRRLIRKRLRYGSLHAPSFCLSCELTTTGRLLRPAILERSYNLTDIGSSVPSINVKQHCTRMPGRHPAVTLMKLLRYPPLPSLATDIIPTGIPDIGRFREGRVIFREVSSSYSRPSLTTHARPG